MNTESRSARRALGLGASLALALLAACGGGAADEAAADSTAATPQVVLSASDLASVGTTELQGGVALTGSLQPYRVVEVKSQVPGVVQGLSVDRGSAVRQGPS